MHTVQSGGPTGDPEEALKPPSRETARWAAILCFIAAFMCLVGIAWSVYARWVTDDSFGGLDGHLTQDATSALNAMDTLNTVVAVLNAILAAALVVGGIMLFRRKPAGRPVVAVTGAFLLLAPIITYVVSTQIWNRLVGAMGETSDVEVMRFGPGAGTVIRGALVALVMLGLVLAPSTKRWLTYQGQPDGQRQLAAVPGSVVDPSLPPPTRGTALGAAVLSVLGGAVFLFLAIAGVVEALDSDKRESARVVAGVGAAVTTPLAAGLIVGGILLLRRRLSGRTTVVVTWAVVILLATGLLSAVTASDNPRPGDLELRIAVLVFTVVYAVAAIALALARSTRRWCETRTGFGRQTLPGPEHPAPMGVTGPLAPAQHQPQPIELPFGAGTPAHVPPTAPVDAARRKRIWVIAAAAGTVMVLAAATAVTFTTISRKPEATVLHSYGTQSVLPFTELSYPWDIAVDAAGAVYVVDSDTVHETSRVLSLPVGATAPSTLPFEPGRNGVAVDAAGTVYVNNGYDGVQVLTAGSSTPTKLSFPGRHGHGVAVDTAGTVYVADKGRVLSRAAGEAPPIELPFTGLDEATFVTVDAAGTVYVLDQVRKRILSLRSGSTTQSEFPLTGLKGPSGLAVDSRGTIYVADYTGGKVVAFAAGSHATTVLPFTGLRGPLDVAVDADGNVYVSGYVDFSDDSGQVLKLPVASPA
ncbi:NHL repeat-containing protein [Mycobacteroides salmoniphilum]|uniref:NHL repeat-containing protein n=1 Tax=Mycobacteroides salmoniphilum TaxID=404941 RepID=UPI00099429BF|nr:NHL repeat-containing protein [Mycobacteroides salmoniphilum]QCH22647.1 Serine/threonine-protein kinase PknD [Mycobacteroides salmoniphilum]